MNEYLTRKPFDLYELQLVRLVATSGSFTRAAEKAGLTQSAVTRQIAAVEGRLGVSLFERTTRRVKTTPAGVFFIEESRKIAGDVEALTQRMVSDFAEAPPVVRIGLSRSIALAYYPGFLFSSRRTQPNLITQISQDLSPALILQIEEGALDVAVVTKPARLPDSLKIVHRFSDSFVTITSDAEAGPQSLTKRGVADWAIRQTWILLHENTETGRRLRRWMKSQGLDTNAITQADNFDLIINLVSMGFGASLVPHRALALYARKKGLKRILTRERFSREMVILVRRHRSISDPIRRFIEGILF